MKRLMIVVILIIIGAITIFLLSPNSSFSQSRRQNRARGDVTKIIQAVKMCSADNADIPPMHQEKLRSYIPKETQQDPWGHEYRYILPGKVHPTGYDVICYGADGKPGGERWNSDIVDGVDSVMPVKIPKITKIVCLDCGKTIKSEKTTEILPYKEAQKYRSGQEYRYITVSEKGTKRCSLCQEKIDAKTKILYLVGKSRKEILEILGEPSETEGAGFLFSTGIGWKYENHPFPDYSTNVEFLVKSNPFYGKGDDANKALNVSYVNTHYDGKYNPDNTRRKFTDIIPSTIYQKEPSAIYLSHISNTMLVVWKFGANKYMAELASSRFGIPLYTESRKLNEVTGQYDYTYKPAYDYHDLYVNHIYQVSPIYEDHIIRYDAGWEIKIK